ncbi:TonB family protein [bacterium]|nr:TonB family protein [candidate division CSSED10-310 bacterium]
MIRSVIITLSVLLLLVPCLAQDEQVFDKPILIEKSELPDVPRVLKKSNITGVALIRVLVSKSGAIDDVGMVRTTGLSTLDNFLIDWVKEWSFLPKLQDNETASGFTIISIRYDLANNSFESPPVNSLTMILPEPYMKLFAATPLKRTKREKTEISPVTIIPIRSLDEVSIPEIFLQKGISLIIVPEVSVDSKGHCVDVHRPEGAGDDDVWEWLSTELLKMEWPPASDDAIRRISVNVVISPENGRLKIGECLLKKP